MTTFDRLVVGVDGSDGSQGALGWAAAQVPDGHVTIIHAFPPGFKLFAAAFQINLDPQRAEHNRLLVTTWSEPARTAGVEFEVELVDDDPAPAVMGAAERTGADAIVVGHQGHSQWSEHHIGHIASQLLHRSDTVLVLTNDSAEALPVAGPVMIGLSDPSEADTAELDWGLAFAHDRGLAVHLVCLVESIVYADAVYVVDMEKLVSIAADQMNVLVADLRRRFGDIEISSEVLLGYPVTRLAEAAKAVDAGVVVVGAHHRQAVSGFLLGSVARLLPPLLECPLVAVPLS